MPEETTATASEQVIGLRLYPAQVEKVEQFMKQFRVNRSEAIRMMIDASDPENVLEVIRYRIRLEA